MGAGKVKSTGYARLLLPLLVLLTTMALPSWRSAHADPVLPLMRGAVVDAAGVLGPDQGALLGRQLTAMKARSKIELVVVTLPSLQGYAIERWGAALAEAWYVGGKNGLGALLIVAPKERLVRIQVGEALSHILTDVESSVIIETRIIPRLRDRDLSGGILAGIDAMVQEVMPPLAGNAPQSSEPTAVETPSPPLAEPVLPLMLGPVVDAAEILGADAAQLDAQLRAIKHRSGIELVVVTLPSLQGRTLESWGGMLSEAWYVGGKNGLGALLIVAPEERMVRIKIGDGLRHLLNDGEAAVIITTQIVPRLKSGDLAGGVVAGAAAMIDEVMPTPVPEGVEQPTPLAPRTEWALPKIPWGLGLSVAGGLIVFVIVVIRGLLPRSPVTRPSPAAASVVRRRGSSARSSTISYASGSRR